MNRGAAQHEEGGARLQRRAGHIGHDQVAGRSRVRGRTPSRWTSASARTSIRSSSGREGAVPPGCASSTPSIAYAAEFLTPAIKANGLYEQKYPMVSGLARPCIVEEVVKVAREVGASTVAHGCTGKGNDQVRFEVGFGVLAPDLEVLAPIRDAGIPRDKAIALAAEWGIPIANVVTTYSVDENLWGRTAECGPLEDPWVAPPEDAFERTAPPIGSSQRTHRDHRRVRARCAGGARWRDGAAADADRAARCRSVVPTGSAGST